MALDVFYRFNGNATNAISGSTASSGGSGTVTYPNNVIDLPKTKYLNCGNIVNYTSTDFTYSICVRAIGWSDAGSNLIFCKNLNTYNNPGVYFMYNSSTAISFVTCQTGAIQFSEATGDFALGKFLHLVVTRAGNSVRIWVDGVDKTTTAGTHVNPGSTSASLYINTYVTSGTTYSGNTRYDDFKAEARKWSNAEIKNEYSRVKGFF